jgi:Tfp pilus assembly protein PilF
VPSGSNQRETEMQASEAFELGVGYLEKKQLDKAMVAFSEAIRLDPKFAQAYNGRGIIFALQGDTEKALADCCEAIRLNPEDPDFYRSRAYLYEELDEQPKADADLAKAEELEGAE